MASLVLFGVTLVLTFLPSLSLTSPSVKVGAASFKAFQPALPADFNVVKAGGWNEVFTLSAEPKESLASYLSEGLKGNSLNGGKLDTILALLYSRGKGFDSSMLGGEWKSIMVKRGTKDPKITTKDSISKYDMEEFLWTKEFSGRKSFAQRVLKFHPVGKGFSKGADGKTIILRRIEGKTLKASYKFSKLPTIPMLRRKHVYEDTLYLDQDICVVKDHRNQVNIYVRPDYLSTLLA